nr:phosphatase PAP2 family protein [Paenibacillus turpanensis]
MDGLLSVFSALGSVPFFAAVLVVAFLGIWLVGKRIRDAFLVLLSLLVSYGLNTLIKNTVARPRPEGLDRLLEADGYSFPSGNAMIAAAFYGFLAYVLWKGSSKSPAVTSGTAAFAGNVILGTGLFRIYAGVHYPTDIIAGFLLGGAIAAGFVLLREKLSGKR